METVASERLEEIFEMHKRAEEALEKEERPRLSEEEYDSRLREAAVMFAEKCGMNEEEYKLHRREYLRIKNDKCLPWEKYDYERSHKEYESIVEEREKNKEALCKACEKYAQRLLERLKASGRYDLGEEYDKAFAEGAKAAFMSEYVGRWIDDEFYRYGIAHDVSDERLAEAAADIGMTTEEYARQRESYYKCEDNGEKWVYIPENEKE